jgi:hypothetical protein
MTFRLRSEKVCKNRHHVIAKLQNSIRHSGDEKGLELNALVYSFSKTLINRYGILLEKTLKLTPLRRSNLPLTRGVNLSPTERGQFVRLFHSGGFFLMNSIHSLVECRF